jgi:hypothetical protein
VSGGIVKHELKTVASCVVTLDHVDQGRNVSVDLEEREQDALGALDYGVV